MYRRNEYARIARERGGCGKKTNPLGSIKKIQGLVYLLIGIDISGCKSHNLLIYTLVCGERGKGTYLSYFVV